MFLIGPSSLVEAVADTCLQSDTWPSSTASLRSSVVRAREENGRIYHGYKDGKYVLPTDQVCDMPMIGLTPLFKPR